MMLKGIGAVTLSFVLLLTPVTPLWLPRFNGNDGSHHIQEPATPGGSGYDGVLDFLPDKDDNSTPVIGIAKRMLYPALPADRFDALAQEGARWLENMWRDDFMNQKYFDDGDITESGWEVHTYVTDPGPHPYIALYHGLWGVSGLTRPGMSASVDVNAPKVWTDFSTIQGRSFGLENQPTNARFGNIYSPDNRFIVVYEAIDLTIPAGDLPPVHAWSDIAFAQYAGLGQRRKIEIKPGGPEVAPPQWCAFIVTDFSTLSLITTILNQLGHHQSIPDEPVTIPIGTRAFKALLTSPAVQGFAQLLIQHKFRFGTYSITSITIHGSSLGETTQGAYPGYEVASLLLHAAKTYSNLINIRGQNEDYEVENARYGRYDWPCKVRPQVFDQMGKLVPWRPSDRTAQGAGGQAVYPEPAGQASTAAGTSNAQGSWYSQGHYGMKRGLHAVSGRISDLTESTTSIIKRGNWDSHNRDGTPELLEEGRSLESMMFADEDSILPDQVEVVPFNTLEENGWDLKLSYARDKRPLQILHGLVGVEHLAYVQPQVNDPVSLAYPQQWMDSHEDYENNEVSIHYHSVYSRAQGVAAILSVKTPAPPGLTSGAPLGIPEPHDWGSLLAAIYPTTEAGLNGWHPAQILPPRWILISIPEDEAISPQTQEVMGNFRAIHKLDRVPQLPGLTFPIGSDVYRKLLATPTIKQVVWAFITRKDLFGDAVIGSITVFDSNPNTKEPDWEAIKPTEDDDDHSSDEQLQFLIYLQRKSPELQKVREGNAYFENHEQAPLVFTPKDPSIPFGPLSSKDGPNWPHPMRPLWASPHGGHTLTPPNPPGEGLSTSQPPYEGGKGQERESGLGGLSPGNPSENERPADGGLKTPPLGSALEALVDNYIQHCRHSWAPSDLLKRVSLAPALTSEEEQNLLHVGMWLSRWMMQPADVFKAKQPQNWPIEKYTGDEVKRYWLRQRTHWVPALVQIDGLKGVTWHHQDVAARQFGQVALPNPIQTESDPKEWNGVKMSQSFDWIQDNHHYRATQGTYGFTSSMKYRTFVLESVNIPWSLMETSQAAKRLGHPPVRDFGAIFRYEGITEGYPITTLPLPAWIYIMGPSVLPRMTIEALTYSLGCMGLNKIPAWPGLTFPIGSTEYYLLLGTPIIREIALSLVNYKSYFNGGVIASITVFDSGVPTTDGRYVPNFLLYLVPPSQELETAEAANLEYDTELYTEYGRLPIRSYPYPMTPTKK